MKKFTKRKEGITLIALVITVVVMLILAGVAIAAVVDGEGLFSKTRQATETYENAVRDEADLIQSLKNEIDEHIEDNLTDGNHPAEPIKNPLKTIVNVNQTYDGGTKGTFSNPIIPKGFAPINENGATWESADGYKYGLVITDEVNGGESTGNEFVWVPVDGTTVTFARLDWNNQYGYDASDCTETVPEEITTSVTNNGGFYIARYEAGIAENMPQVELSSDSSDTYGTGEYRPVSKQGAIVWKRIQWGANNDDTNPGNGAVTTARSMYPEEDENYGVASTLIYGAQWDTALKFIGAYNVGEENYNTYATNSTGMGNYDGTSGDDTFSGIATCGAAPSFRQKNIYDMAGNVSEWTMEKYSSSCVYRSGNCNYHSGLDGPASRRDNGIVDGNYLRFSCCALYKVALSLKGQ